MEDFTHIALCDARAFYASAEAAYNPGLRTHGKIAVTSSNDGAIISLTEKAKALGVKKFEPYFKQKALCDFHGVEVFSANFELYGHISKRISDTLAEEVPRLEVYSIDESFLDVSGIQDIKSFGHHLRSRIWREQRIPVGVSVSTTKTLAKMAQCATKLIPSINGVCVLETEVQRVWLAKRLPVKEIWGVGRALSAKLESIGVLNALDLMRLPLVTAKRIGGINVERTVMELNGIQCISLETEPPPKEQLICSRSFGSRTTDINVLRHAISTFVVSACEKLRKQNSYAGRISVWIESSRFDENPVSASGSSNVIGGSDDASRLIKICMPLLDSLYKEDVRYAKAGIALFDIRPNDKWQMDLLSPSSISETSKAMKVMDGVNAKHGRGTVFLAAQGTDNKFAPRQERLSQRYLSAWSDIPKVCIS